jgi:Tol biopolymer transport system component
MLSADGGDLRPMAETINVSSAAGWSPDGKWIVAGGTDKEGPGLLKIPVESGASVRLTKGRIDTLLENTDLKSARR